MSATPKQSPSALLRKCSTKAIRDAIGYFKDEAQQFPECHDTPAIRACMAWMRNELNRRKK